MKTIIIIVALLTIYFICYKILLKKKCPFKYIVYYKDLYKRKNNIKLTLYFNRKDFFGLGITYTNGISFNYVEQKSNTMAMRVYTFALHFIFISIVWKVWKFYKNKYE